MSGFFFAAAAKAVTVEQPTDGQTGVWVKSGTTVISSAMTMTGLVTSSGWSTNIYSGGVLSDYVLQSAGMVVRSGGLAVSGVAYRALTVSRGGVVSSVILNHPGETTDVYNHAGVRAFDVTLIAGQLQQFAGAASSYVSGVIVSGGTLTVRTRPPTGGMGGAYDIVQYGGTVRVEYNGYASGVAVQSGLLNVVSGRAVNVALSGGSMHVYSGGSALVVTSHAGAVVTVDEGGYIEYA